MAGRSLYDQAFAVVHAHEGGFVDHPKDPGGATNHGVSLRWLRAAGRLDLDGDGLMDGDLDGDGDIDGADIRLLQPTQVKALFRHHFWERLSLDRMAAPVAIKSFDLAVNTGPRPAIRCLQRACRANGFATVDDGVIGPQTLASQAGAWTRNPDALLAAFSSEAAGFYRALIAARPEQFSVFRKGWLARAYYRPRVSGRFSGGNHV